MLVSNKILIVSLHYDFESKLLRLLKLVRVTSVCQISVSIITVVENFALVTFPVTKEIWGLCRVFEILDKCWEFESFSHF